MNKRIELARLDKYDSETRNSLLAGCKIEDVGLARLINDLLKKPADQMNLRILTSALDGIYTPTSDLHSSLCGHLEQAGYADMVQNQKDHKYEHNRGARPLQHNQVDWGNLDDSDIDEIYGVSNSGSLCTLS